MFSQILSQFSKELKNVDFGNSWANIRETMEEQISSERLRNIAAEIGKKYQIKFSLEIINAWKNSTDQQKMELLKYLSLQNDHRDLGLKIFVADDQHAYFKSTLDIRSIKPNDLEIKINAAYYSYQQEKRRLKEQISLLRSLCNHEKTTYHPDASGNNDSCYTCDECGLEKKRFHP